MTNNFGVTVVGRHAKIPVIIWGTRLARDRLLIKFTRPNFPLRLYYRGVDGYQVVFQWSALSAWYLGQQMPMRSSVSSVPGFLLLLVGALVFPWSLGLCLLRGLGDDCPVVFNCPHLVTVLRNEAEILLCGCPQHSSQIHSLFRNNVEDVNKFIRDCLHVQHTHETTRLCLSIIVSQPWLEEFSSLSYLQLLADLNIPVLSKLQHRLSIRFMLSQSPCWTPYTYAARIKIYSGRSMWTWQQTTRLHVRLGVWNLKQWVEPLPVLTYRPVDSSDNQSSSSTRQQGSLYCQTLQKTSTWLQQQPTKTKMAVCVSYNSPMHRKCHCC